MVKCGIQESNLQEDRTMYKVNLTTDRFAQVLRNIADMWTGDYHCRMTAQDVYIDHVFSWEVDYR